MRRYLIPALLGSVVTAIVGPVILPLISQLLRPLVKIGIKTGVTAYQSSVVKLDELKESLEDILAEVREEKAPEE